MSCARWRLRRHRRPALAMVLQLAAPARAFLLIRLGMALMYVLAVALVLGENRRDFRPAHA